jgi:ubiquinone/menaquinone biosynthesis C-methylase UbiE
MILKWYNNFVDRIARKPAGKLGRQAYQEPMAHYPSFWITLDKLHLTGQDRLLEIGCGGGVFLDMALRSINEAAAIDHSPDMIALAGERNRGAIKEGRLELKQGDAAALPWPDNSFSCVASTNVFFFLPEPYKVLEEIRRVLAPGGRLVISTMSKSWKSQIWRIFPLRLYTDQELTNLLQQAGFKNSQVTTYPDKMHQVAFATK